MYNKGTIASRYSNALFELSNELNISSQISSDLRSCNEIIMNNNSISRIMFNYLTPSKLQIGMIQYLEKLGSFNQLTNRFLNVLARNRRCFMLPQIIKIYKDFFFNKLIFSKIINVLVNQQYYKSVLFLNKRRQTLVTA